MLAVRRVAKMDSTTTLGTRQQLSAVIRTEPLQVLLDLFKGSEHKDTPFLEVVSREVLFTSLSRSRVKV